MNYNLAYVLVNLHCLIFYGGYLMQSSSYTRKDTYEALVLRESWKYLLLIIL